MLNTDDTIVAIATAPGGGYRGVVRLSGPDALAAVLPRLQFPTESNDIQVAKSPMVFCGVFDFQSSLSKKTLPPLEVEVFYWPTNRSYTRQRSVEIHTIGSTPVLQAILQEACQAGARLAEPGEFTMRSFLAGRLDLTQAEAVLGVIDADNSEQLDTALTQLAGGISQPLNKLREDLLNLLAELEAGLDFVEEDIEFITAKQLDSQLATAETAVVELLEQMKARTNTSELFRVVLLGAANAGKSSLFNSLTEETSALVSNIAGTTRDYLTAEMKLPAITCQLIDTAGLETTHALNEIEQHAQEFSEQQRSAADLVLYCLDSTLPVSETELEAIKLLDPKKTVLVYTKIDECKNIDKLPSFETLTTIKTSSTTSIGLTTLQQAIQTAALVQDEHQSTFVSNTAQRCRASLTAAQEGLIRARELATGQITPELVAFEVRFTLDHLGQVVGAVYTDDILDRIFGQFCIGK